MMSEYDKHKDDLAWSFDLVNINAKHQPIPSVVVILRFLRDLYRAFRKLQEDVKKLDKRLNNKIKTDALYKGGGQGG